MSETPDADGEIVIAPDDLGEPELLTRRTGLDDEED